MTLSLKIALILFVAVPAVVSADEFRPVTTLDEMKWMLGKWKAQSPIQGPEAPDLGKPGDELTIDMDIRRDNKSFFLKRVNFSANGKTRPEEIVVMGVDPATKQFTTWVFLQMGGTFIGTVFTDGNNTYETRGKGRFGKQEIHAVITAKVKDANTHTVEFRFTDADGQPIPGMNFDGVDTFVRQD